MKLQMESRRHLGELNIREFFCKGCGMVQASEKCSHCVNLSTSKKRTWPSLLQILQTTEAIVVLIIFIAIITLFYNGVLK